MKGVTIDKLDIKDHLRWAQDQEILDAALVSEASLVAHHPEILGMSMIYSSKFEELFELQKRNQHWACFSPPENFQLFKTRFFSYRLFPNIHWEGDEDSKSDSEAKEEDGEFEIGLISTLVQVKAPGNQFSVLFEKDKDALISLLKSIQWINKLLKQINGRKLQYQKG